MTDLQITRDRDRFYVMLGNGPDAPMFFVEGHYPSYQSEPQGSLVRSVRNLPRTIWAVFEKMTLQRWNADLKSPLTPIEFVQQFTGLFFAEQTRREIKLSGFQIKAAYALAAAHGHRWAQVREVEYYLQNRTVGALEDNPAPYGPLDMIGLDHPNVVAVAPENGLIVHETGTSRLKWTISHQMVTLQVKRPEGTALAVAIDSPLKGGDVRLLELVEKVSYGERHVATLEKCLRALLEANLMTSEASDRLLAEIRESDLYHDAVAK